ncbi:LysR family transcriptional regulator [Peribacillus butanolivorans]|uniref:LysR family transcriptional regulator n=1 Tax=Peribacillus butanolivorans TaxID=421767 RepID=UPI003668E0E1
MELMKIEIRHLKYFIAVAEELNFGRAACRLNISQPPLSRQIKQLEEEIGAELFYRTKQKVELTVSGKVLLDCSYKILEKIDQACKDTLKAAEGKQGSILISYASGTNETLMKIITLFQKQFPEVKLYLHQSISTKIIEDLEDEKIHIGVIPPFENDSINFKMISSSPYGVILPITHRLADRSTPIHIKELAQDSFIYYSSQNSIYFYHLKSICNQGGFDPRVSLDALGLSGVISCVAAGMGVSIASKLTMKQYPNPKIVFKELVPETELKTCLAWRMDEKSRSVLNFLDFAVEYLENNIVYT